MKRLGENVVHLLKTIVSCFETLTIELCMNLGDNLCTYNNGLIIRIKCGVHQLYKLLL